MYKILCDGQPLHYPAYGEYTVGSPSLTLETSKAGSLSFTIYPTHPNFNNIQKMKSIITVSENDTVIFRGRVFSDEANFYKVKKVEVEGCLAYFNDSIVREYEFTGSVLEYITFLINQHNEQVAEFQRFKLGAVTVEDENEYIVRSNSTLPKTWDEIDNKLIKLLGGYLVVRYEADGNYIDYLKDLTYTNTQPIKFGENLLDLSDKYDASNTYSAMIPRGAEVEDDGAKSITTITGLPNEDITDDIVKQDDMIYSKNAVNKYGWIFAPIAESTWSDVTQPGNLLTKAIAKLTGTGQLLTNIFQINAVNLNYSDSEIASFRVSQNVIVKSAPHGINDTLPLTKLVIDISNPQNTKITVGKTALTLTDGSIQTEKNTADRITSAEKDIENNRNNVTNLESEVLTQRTELINDCQQIIFTALEEYVKTGDYEAYKESVTAQLEILADKISLNFNSTTEQITTVNGELQAVIENLTKHFDFSVDGLTIKAGENTMQLLIDNDVVSFTKNGQQFGWWDGVDFHTGNIIIDVNERAQFGNFAFVPRSDGSLSFLKLGG